MPFTPTHMLAALPIARHWSSPGIFSALMIGSMVPDWPMYITVGPEYQLTHSFPGIFIACMPLGLAVTLLFLAVVRRPLLELAPSGLQQRLVRFVNAQPELTAGSFARLALAVCVGATTHIVWDAFTHHGAWGVELLPGPFMDFLDPWGNRIEIIDYTGIQFTKAPYVLKGMGLEGLGKTGEAIAELTEKGMAPD